MWVMRGGGWKMTVKELSDRFDVQVVAGEKGLNRPIDGGYCGDLLSDVMANAPQGCIWLTVQGHQNIVAIAVLKEMAAIVITGGHKPDPETVEKAGVEEIPILAWEGSAYDLTGRIHAAGVRNSDG